MRILTYGLSRDFLVVERKGGPDYYGVDGVIRSSDSEQKECFVSLFLFFGKAFDEYLYDSYILQRILASRVAAYDRVDEVWHQLHRPDVLVLGDKFAAGVLEASFGYI